MDVWALMEERYILFLLILPRLTGVFLLAPVFGGRFLPLWRVALSLVVAAVLLPVVPVPPSLPDTPWLLALAAASELVLGIAMGYVTLLAFTAVQVAGQVVDMGMGFGIVNVIDPQMGIQVPLMGNFLYLLALVVFLLLDGHHLILTALVRSFLVIPPGGASLPGNLASFLMDAFGQMFLVAVSISVPVVASLFVVTVALGIVGRTVPQMNVFVVGLPLMVLTGTVVLILGLPFFLMVVRTLTAQMETDLVRLLGLVAP